MTQTPAHAQSTNSVLMIRPNRFYPNPETAADNAFQRSADYDYNEKEIAEVAERSKKLAREARDVHVIFNNNNLDYAPHAAIRLRKALGQIVNAPSGTLELF